MYALKHVKTGKLMGFYATSNGGEGFCSSVTFELDRYSDNLWVTDSKDVAERLTTTNTDWYNAGFKNPINDYVGELLVVEFVEKSQE